MRGVTRPEQKVLGIGFGDISYSPSIAETIWNKTVLIFSVQYTTKYPDSHSVIVQAL